MINFCKNVSIVGLKALARLKVALCAERSGLNVEDTRSSGRS
jgi:hypothetical protein